MRLLIPSMILINIALVLSACSSSGRTPGQLASNFFNGESIKPTTHELYPAKNPQIVTFYNQRKAPLQAYRVIGVAKVSKHNLLGTTHQEQALQTMIKQLAASIGGDALIDISNTPEAIEGKVIAFQKIML